jgi:hypothetical protein
MSTPPSEKVQVNLGQSHWPNTRPVLSEHKHIGYILNSDNREVKISPEFTINDQNRVTRIGHEYVIMRNWSPRPLFNTLHPTEVESDIMELSYVDPTERSGTLTIEEISRFQASVFWFLGYIVEETETEFKLAMSSFAFSDGLKEYEYPHIIPKGSILSQTYYSPHRT